MARKISGTRRNALIALFAGLTLAGAGDAARGTEATPDFSGLWSRTTFGLEQPEKGPGPVRAAVMRAGPGGNGQFNVGDEKAPILKPAAADAVRRRNESQFRGVDVPTPSNQCLPMAVPYIFRVQGLQVIQKKDEVMLIYMQDHQVRHVRLAATHGAKITPSWWGDSIGHYEDDTLVVDTIGFKVGPASAVDQYGAPFSGGLHTVERYRLISYEEAKAAQDRIVRENGGVATEQAAGVDPNYRGKGLQVQVTVEDSKYFTMPWGAAATYRKAGTPWVENVCAENPHEYYANKLTPVPTATKPDF